MPYAQKTFRLLGKSGKYKGTLARQVEACTLFGLEGFAYHRHGGDRKEWRVSSVETGAMIGKGFSKEAAMNDALTKAQSRENLIEGIRRVKKRIARDARE